jgi:ADP-ribose pyrophosphatase
MAYNDQPEQVLESSYLYRGRIINLRLDIVGLPKGHTAHREIVEHGQVAAVVPIDEEGRVLMVRQFRLALGRYTLEIPAGGLDPGETPEEAARRELEEETGFQARLLRRLGGFYVSPGYCTEYIHIFLARDLTPGQSKPDLDEATHPVWLSLREAIAMATSGQLEDGKTIIGLLWAAATLNSP